MPPIIIIIIPVSNPCLEGVSNCSHMCLLSSESPIGYSCVCPDGFVPSESRSTCSSKAKSLLLQLQTYICILTTHTIQCAQIILSYVKILIVFLHSGSVMVLTIVEITVMKTIVIQVK